MASTAFPTRDDFAAMLDESLGGADGGFEGRVVKGTVTAIENDLAVIDIGLKSEGRVPLREFAAPGQKADLKVGDEVEVYVDRVENANGETMLSRDRARREPARDRLEEEFNKETRGAALLFRRREGRVPLREFAAPGQKADLKVGDEVEVYVDRVENANGETMLSRDRARREAAWDRLEEEFNKEARVEGVIFGRVKGGFTVDLGGAVAFLPGSQVDIRPVRDVGPLMDLPQPFQILQMDRRRGNIVVSRRAILEETRAEQRSGLIQNLEEGQIIEGPIGRAHV